MSDPNLGWGLPPGVSDRDCEGPEPRDDDDGMTKSERDAEAKGEADGDCAREEA